MSPAKPWLKIKVVLVSGCGEEFEAPPGRVMLGSADNSLAELAEAIDLAFARWDMSHLHMFTLPNGLALASEDDEIDAEAGATTSNARLGATRSRSSERCRKDLYRSTVGAGSLTSTVESQRALRTNDSPKKLAENLAPQARDLDNPSARSGPTTAET